jgi:FtsZ-binding cell division protein ZapB
MKIKDLQIQLHEAIDFIDALQKNVQEIAHKDQRDANQVTDGTGDILRGRAELAYIIDEKIQDWKEEL